MITLLIFSIAFILIYILNLCVFLGAISFASITFIYLGSVVGIFLINLLVAGVCCKIFPNKWFNDQFRLYRPTKKECRFYEKIGIKKWKDKIKLDYLDISLYNYKEFKRGELDEEKLFVIYYFIISRM